MYRIDLIEGFACDAGYVNGVFILEVYFSDSGDSSNDSNNKTLFDSNDLA